MTKTVLDYDVVIIGSGAGGGTVAKELAPLCGQGLRVALLEWGGHFGRQDNTRDEIGMARKYYFDQGGFQTAQRDMTLAFARAVGGSTTVYTGTSLTMNESILGRWNVPGLALNDLKPRYEKYIRENGVHLKPRSELNRNNLLFEEGCRKLGWHYRQFPVNTRGCVGLATCNLGCMEAAYPFLQMILALAIDDPLPQNYVGLHNGRPRVEYHFTEKTIGSFVAAVRASTRLFFASGAECVHAPAMDRFFIHKNEAGQIDSLIDRKHFKLGKISISAAHLMGGCRMGENPQTSVTDVWGRVHGLRDIYVADAGLFPAASEVNPYLTIMALADRVAEGVRKDLEEGK